MKIYRNIEDFRKLANPVVTVGTFDGVHVGHQKIIGRMKDLAKEVDGETVVVTFHPHPRLVVQPNGRDLKFINTEEKKFELLEMFGIDHLIVINFTKEFAKNSSIEFVKDILVDKVGTKNLIIGYDHHFGNNREGSFENLKILGDKFGFNVEEVEAQYIHNLAVSSTQIRNALKLGKVFLANELLGYEYSITGNVVPGKKLGRKMGFPTANIEIQDEYKLISAVGVYSCKIMINGKSYLGMGNIGYRPTVDDGDLTIEVHIFDFDEEIYNQTIAISFVERIRDEIKFESLDALKMQLDKDKMVVLDKFVNN
ncbi:bifunctional riboflavin kinase/FAD synthetase [Bacteroidota bacterium]